MLSVSFGRIFGYAPSESDGAVSSVVGYLIHNDLCRHAVMKRLPAVPLHPHVYEVALAQLESGSRYVLHRSLVLRRLNVCTALPQSSPQICS